MSSSSRTWSEEHSEGDPGSAQERAGQTQTGSTRIMKAVGVLKIPRGLLRIPRGLLAAVRFQPEAILTLNLLGWTL